MVLREGRLSAGNNRTRVKVASYSEPWNCPWNFVFCVWGRSIVIVTIVEVLILLLILVCMFRWITLLWCFLTIYLIYLLIIYIWYLIFRWTTLQWCSMIYNDNIKIKIYNIQYVLFLIFRWTILQWCSSTSRHQASTLLVATRVSLFSRSRSWPLINYDGDGDNTFTRWWWWR